MTVWWPQVDAVEVADGDDGGLVRVGEVREFGEGVSDLHGASQRRSGQRVSSNAACELGGELVGVAAGWRGRSSFARRPTLAAMKLRRRWGTQFVGWGTWFVG